MSNILQAKDGVINAGIRQSCEIIDGGRCIHAAIPPIASNKEMVVRRLFNLIVGSPNRLAMQAQYVQFAPQFIPANLGIQVASVCILRNQPQRLAFPNATNQDRRMWLLHSLRRIERASKLVMFALVRRVIARPHPVCNLQCLFQAFIPFRRRWERDAEPLMLFLVPGRANPQIGPSMRQHIQGTRRLDENAWMPVGHTRHQRAEFDTIGAPGGKSQRAPRLKHFALNRAYLLKLKEMIHHPQAIEPGFFCPFYDQSKGVA